MSLTQTVPSLREETVGRHLWVIADGYLPASSKGPKPELTSHETVCLLNLTDEPVEVRIWIYFADREPVGPYELRVEARRTLHARINELTKPEPVPVATPFAALIGADGPIVAQHTRLDSRQAENALLSTIPYAQ